VRLHELEALGVALIGVLKLGVDGDHPLRP
jgi:hypothetical protein